MADNPMIKEFMENYPFDYSKIPPRNYMGTDEPLRAACQHRQGKSLEPGVFGCPNSIVIDPETKNVFVCDAVNDRVQVLTELFEFAYEFNESMDTPFGVCISEDRVFVTQCLGNHLNVYSKSKRGKLLNLVGKPGDKPLQFDYPTGVAVSIEKKRIYVCDMMNCRIQCLNMDFTFNSFILDLKHPQDVKMLPDKIVVLSLDEKCVRFYSYEHKLLKEMIPIGVGFPTQICIDPKNKIILSNGMANLVTVFSPDGEVIQKMGGRGIFRGKLILPSGIALDSQNRLIVVSQHHRECIQLFELKCLSYL